VKVFVSHSTQDNDTAGAILDAIYDQLTAKKYDVFLDFKILKPGDQWRSELYLRLAECHAAILLLSEKALQSPWVRREIDLLLWRRALGSSVEIIPVLLDGLQRDKIRSAGFSELESIEFARASGGDASDVQAETIAKIMGRFATLSDGTDSHDKMADWIKRIAEYLAEIKDPDPLVEAAKALDIPADDLANVMAPVGGRWFIAHQMLGPGLSGRLGDAIAAVAYKLSEDWLRRLIELVKPVWVDPEAARLMLPPRDGPDRMLILLNAVLAETAGQYVERAICCATAGYHHESVGPVRVGEEGALGLLAPYEKALRELYSAPPAPLPLTEPPANGSKYFLIVNAEPHDFATVLGVVREIQEKYSRLIVIMLTGNKALDDGARENMGLHNCIVLEPMLKDGEETDGYRFRHELDRIFMRATGRGSGDRNA
jgi:TIR domain